MTDTKTLIKAMRALANDIQTDDGIANAAIREAADRLEELQAENERLRRKYGKLQQYNSSVAEENCRLRKELELTTDRCIKAVEEEPEYPGEPPKELMMLIEQAVSGKDSQLVLHIMRHSVRLTKSEIVSRIRGLHIGQSCN